ncbi:MAG: translation machinery-associated protein 20 [Cyphobasidiales sp. Tagirdzhanova-0007]|nr:MAG: translation machinery-associated protein 20 [Cyphobasidiales sp. Tagirdzhanova-0007]
MFKKFSRSEDVASSTAVKSSIQRGIRSKLVEQMPLLSQASPSHAATTATDGDAETITLLDTLWPKKEGLTLVKCRDHISIFALHGTPLFFQHFEGPYFPTLRLLHQYPDLLPKVQVDKGAIKFVLAGANIMCPGLTSPGGYLTSSLAPETAVAIFAESKHLPCAVGLMKMSTEEIRKVNKGIGVDNVQFLGDELWLNGKEL